MNKTIFKLFLFLSFLVGNVSYAHSKEYLEEKLTLHRMEFEKLRVKLQDLIIEGEKGYPIANRSAALIKEITEKKAEIEATFEEYYAYIYNYLDSILDSLLKRQNQCINVMDFMEKNGINSEMLGAILAMRDREMAGNPPDRNEVIQLANKFNINDKMINEFKNLGLNEGEFQ